MVLEIGSGRGALTRHLVGRCRTLIAVELDGRLCETLRSELGGRAEVRHADFLTAPLPDRPYKVLGNVPFARTTEIVRRLVEARCPPEDAWLIVQREAGQRFAGAPHGPETLWSLRLKPWWHVEVLQPLRRTDFDPPPSVNSSLLWLSRRARPLLTGREAGVYRELTERVFRAGRPVAAAARGWLTRTQVRQLARELRFAADGPPSALRFDQWLVVVRFAARRADASGHGTP